MTEKLEIPTEFICPITQELLNDPVIGSDGHTYERTAIEQWLSTHYSSPMTRQPMQASELVPNLALRNIIETMYGKNVPKIKDNSSVVVIPSTPVAASDKVDLHVDATQTGNYEYLVHVSAVPPDQGTRKPCVFIAVLDVSGSMEDEATIGNEGHGFSRLDLVKHSMNTIIHVMEPQDYLAIVAFSSNASVELPLIPMTATGKTQALARVKNLRPDGSTNIWDGLRVGLELTKNPICQNHNIAMVLLTDGEPNINPPRGIVPTLEKYISANPLNCVIHTFGFGYHLDSPLLNEIAQVGSGLYAFIPDASMVGTIFVNFLANTLATSAKRASIVVEKGTSDDISFIGYPSSTDKVDLGTIQYGQTRDLVIKVRNCTTKPNLKVTLKYDSDQEVSVQLGDIHTNNLTELYVQYGRLFMVERLLKIMKKVSSDNNCRDSVRLLNEVVTTLKNMPSCSDKRILAMIRDLESEEENEAQVRKALSKDDWYRKWGRHYIPSLVRAHILQQCNNFKDKGVQLYGGKLFTELQDAADTIFCNLPPPTPSVRGSYHNNSVTNMSTYYNVSSGCFSGDGRVAMADGTTKLVMHLCKDDKVQTVDGRSAGIRCVIKSSTLNPTSSPLVELNGVKVTPYHPVRLNSADKWVFPCDVKQPEYIPCNHVYNLVLESDHIVNINGIEFITLGHGIVDDPVLAHPFYGTDRVIEELQQMEGWDTGLIAINDYEVIRDQETGLVSAIIPKQIPVQ